jgi:hypothetical protein
VRLAARPHVLEQLLSGGRTCEDLFEEEACQLAHGGRVVHEGAQEAVEERAPPLDVLALQQAREQQQRLPPHQLARVAQARRQPGHRTARTKEKGGCQRGGGARIELKSHTEPGWQSSLCWYCADAQVKMDGEAPREGIRGEQ